MLCKMAYRLHTLVLISCQLFSGEAVLFQNNFDMITEDSCQTFLNTANKGKCMMNCLTALSFLILRKMKLFKNKTIGFLYSLCIISITNKPTRFLQNSCICTETVINPLSYKNNYMRFNTCIETILQDVHVYICKRIKKFFYFSKFVSYFFFNCFFFIKNKIHVILSMTLRENVMSVCCCF